MTYELISNFRDNKHLNTDFLNLIKKNDEKATFEAWLTKSRYTDDFMPFGILDEKNSLVACAGVCRTHIFLNDKKHDAVQIGRIFVKEHNDNCEEIKNILLDKLVDKFEGIVDVIYTFVNDNSYATKSLPKLGFHKSGNYEISLDWKCDSDVPLALVVKKVNVEDQKQCDELLDNIKHSSKMSHVVSTNGDSSIKMYNILKKYPRNVFHVPSLDTTIIFTIHDEVFTLIAAFSNKEVDLEKLLKVVVPGHIQKVTFGFIPEIENVKYVPKENNNRNESSFWVKPISMDFNRTRMVMPTLARTK